MSADRQHGGAPIALSAAADIIEAKTVALRYVVLTQRAKAGRQCQNMQIGLDRTGTAAETNGRLDRLYRRLLIIRYRESQYLPLTNEHREADYREQGGQCVHVTKGYSYVPLCVRSQRIPHGRSLGV